MDERENVQKEVNQEEGIAFRDIPAAEGQGKAEGSGSRSGKKKVFLWSILLLAVLAGVSCIMMFYFIPPKGYQNYTVQMEQYYVEYSDQYDYWDVLTVEYPRLEGIDETTQEALNQLMYDTAMDRVYYWHLFPNEWVKDFQEEHYTMFCSDVACDVTYHSQYLVSMDFYEIYCAGNPVWMTNATERALTVDLMTGEVYDLEDILEINREFIKLWDGLCSEEREVEASEDAALDIPLSWFLQQDDEVNEIYQCRPFFYVTQEGAFVIGISLDPLQEEVVTYEPTSRIICTQMDEEILEPYKKQSEFWNKYEKSEITGEVLPCQNKEENLWLGEDAGIWQ